MIAVIFEVWPALGREKEYLDLAATLLIQLERIEGFISIERFQSLREPGKLLSLSFWKDEQAVSKWRENDLHRAAQAHGRDLVFKDYRLRVVSVIRDYGMFDRNEVPPSLD